MSHPLLNKAAPKFELAHAGAQGPEVVTLSELTKDKPAVLLFVPFAFTPTCSAELCTKNASLDAFAKLNANVVGISGDNPFSQAQWAKQEGIHIKLLSDYDHAVAKAYGVTNEAGFNVPKNIIFTGVAKRSAFVVDRAGIVVHAEVLDDASKQPDFAAIEATLHRIAATPLAVGDKAPTFSLVQLGEKGPELVSLESLIVDRPLVILWIPFSFSPICSAELCSKNSALSKFGALNARVVGISGDSPFALKTWAAKEDIKIQLLSDYDHAAARAFKVAYNRALAPPLPMTTVAKRSAFIIDTKGVVQYAEVSDDVQKLPNFEAIETRLGELK